MMRRVAALCALATACSSLPTQGNGVVALQVELPTTPITLMQGDSIVLHARALNLHGDSVAADIVWTTPDPDLIALDSQRGAITALGDSGTARVQASVGNLRSALITIGLRPDTTATSPGSRIVR